MKKVKFYKNLNHLSIPNISIKLVFKYSRDIFHAKDLEFYYWQNLDFWPFRDQGDLKVVKDKADFDLTRTGSTL